MEKKRRIQRSGVKVRISTKTVFLSESPFFNRMEKE